LKDCGQAKQRWGPSRLKGCGGARAGCALWNPLYVTGLTQKIAQAMNWIRRYFADEMRMEELAKTTHMSPITFRQHFRSMTRMSSV